MTHQSDYNIELFGTKQRKGKSRKVRKARRSNRPKSQAKCAKRHMSWNSETKRCNKKKM